MVLTDAGEVMPGYARRLLELNDEAAGALRGGELEGGIRLGLQEDFGETLLPEVLGRFVRAHPKVRIEARIARNAELLDRRRSARPGVGLGGRRAYGACRARRRRTDALDRAGIAWRVAFTRASLAGVCAAVAAGLGVTLRTPLGLPTSVRRLEAAPLGLPVPGTLGLALHRAESEPAPAVTRLASFVRQDLRALLATVPVRALPATGRRLRKK